MRDRRLPSLLTTSVLVAVMALSVVAWWATQRGVERQNQALLQNDTSQIVLVLQVAVQNVGTQLSSLGTATVAANDSKSVFDSQSKAILTQPTVSVALVDTSVSPPAVVLGAGPDLKAGQTLTGALARATTAAGPALMSSKVEHVGAKDFLLFTIVPPLAKPGTVVLETSRVTPAKPAAASTGPFSQLYFAIYASPTKEASQLITSSLGTKPLPKPTATAVLDVGASKWLVVGAARAPLAGTTAKASAWIVLGIGALLALALALMVEVLQRRQRHTAEVVAQREGELLAAQVQLLRKERLSAVGEMATIVGHELRNPLGAAINSLYLVRSQLREPLEPSLDTNLSRAEREVNRAAALSEDLTAYMRERPPAPVPLDLAAVVGEVLETAPPPEGVTVTRRGLEVPLQADRVQVAQVITNLVTNAYQAMPDGGELTLAAGAVDGVVELVVEDRGPGIGQNPSDSLFEPFFTTKAAGTGLGLAIVKRIVDAHDGSVNIENAEGGGARVVVRLPQNGDGRPS